MGLLRGYIEYLLFPLLFLTKRLKNISYIGIIAGVFLIPVTINATAQYSCPGELVANIDNANNSAYMEYNTTDKYVGSKGGRYWKFTPSVSGTITISQNSLKLVSGYVNHALKIGKDSCGDVSILDGGNYKQATKTFDVTEGTTYYVKIQEGNLKDELNVRVTFDFTPNSVENADDLCYNEPYEYDGICMENGIIQVGIQCKTTITLSSLDDITDVQAVVETSGYDASFMDDCGVDDVSGEDKSSDEVGYCSNESTFSAGPFSILNSGIIYNVASDMPEGTDHSIYDEAKIDMSFFSGDTLYGSYIKDGVLHTGKLRRCDLTPNYKCANPHAFKTRFQSIVAGDLVAIGNSNICIDLDKDGVCDTNQRTDPNGNNLRNDKYNNIYINKFSSSEVADQPDNLMNVSGASLNLPEGAKVVKAYIYWQGEVWNFRKGIVVNGDGVDSGDDGIIMMNKANTIEFKTPTDNYQTKTADEFYYFFLKRSNKSYDSSLGDPESFGYGYGPNWGYDDTHAFNYSGKVRYEMHFQGVLDVTDDLQAVENTNGTANGTYWVGNIQSTVGRLWYPGSEAAWTLQVVYTQPDAGSRSISLSDGYVGLYSNATEGDAYATDNSCPTGAENTGVYYRDVNFTISGFLTPKTGDFDSDLTVFVTESDPETTVDADWPEELTVTKKDGTEVVVDGPNAWNYEIKDKNGTDNLDRRPAYIYPMGMTIKNYHKKNLLSLDQTSTNIKFQTDSDKLILGVIGFATDLRAPDVCYDYTMFIDNYKIESKNNEIDTSMGAYSDTLINRMYIRSREGNFNLTDANLTYHLPEPDIVSYQRDSLEIAQNGQYDYVDASDRVITQDDSGFKMRIGEGDNSDIYPYENRYIAFVDDINNSAQNTTFDLKLEAKVDYGIEGVPPIPFTKIFGANDICGDDNGSYNIEYTLFNVVEPQLGYDTYNLFTKVAGQEIDYDIYAYQADDPSSLVNVDLKMPVEVEMIRADDFDRNASISCGDKYAALPETIIPHKVVYIKENKGSFKFLPSDTNFAYPSLSMRIHYLVDDNNTIMTDHNCSRENTSDCKPLYTRYSSTLTKCTNDCTATSSDNTCYECLRLNYDNFSCARDNFTLRPRAFRTALIDSAQTENTSIPKSDISINNNPTDTNPPNIVAGYNYRLDINATSKLDPNNAIPLYIQPFTDTHNKRVAMIWAPDATATNCIDTDDKNLSFTMFYGSTIHPNGDAQLFTIKQVGNYKLEIYDQNLTRYDWYPQYIQHHVDNADHFISDTADCIMGSNSDEPSDSEGRVGCVTDNNLSNANYFPTYERVHPYSFDISGISIGGAPTNDKSVVYYNTLDGNTAYPQGFSNTGDKNMSYNIQGTFFAIDYEGDKTTNFTSECYAQSVDIKLQHRYISPIPNESNTQLVYDLIDYNTTNPSIVYRSDRDAPIDERQMPVPSSTNDVALVITQQRSNFDTDMQGAITMDLGYNFTRDIAVAQNPRLINFKDFNVTYTIQPANVYVDMKNDYKIAKGNDAFDQNITFAYAKVATSKYLYDDINNTSVKTPIYVYVYCDLDRLSCEQRGLNLLNALTNNGNWWKSNTYDNLTKQDGDIVLKVGTIYQGTGIIAISNPIVNINNNGTNDSISVSRDNNATLPLEVGIELVTDPTQPSYTDRWLIYNPNGGTTAPSPFYKVRFIGNSTWSGVGKTGNVVGTDASNKKSKRLDW